MKNVEAFCTTSFWGSEVLTFNSSELLRRARCVHVSACKFSMELELFQKSQQKSNGQQVTNSLFFFPLPLATVLLCWCVITRIRKMLVLMWWNLLALHLLLIVFLSVHLSSFLAFFPPQLFQCGIFGICRITQFLVEIIGTYWDEKFGLSPKQVCIKHYFDTTSLHYKGTKLFFKLIFTFFCFLTFVTVCNLQ